MRECTQIRELHGILDEEDRNVISHNIPVPLFSIEFDGKASYVTHSICAPSASNDCREPHKHGSGTGDICENVRVGDIRRTLVQLEGTKGTNSPRMDNTFGDALMVESVDLGHC